MTSRTVVRVVIALLALGALLGLGWYIRRTLRYGNALLIGLSCTSAGAVILLAGPARPGLALLAFGLAGLCITGLSVLGQVPQGWYWRRRGSSDLIYILRDEHGVPLYWGYTDRWPARVAEHKRKSDPWRRRIHPAHCTPVRWARNRKAGLRIERRRIRAAAVAARWRQCPPPNNDAEMDSARVLFPRLWALLYMVESACFPSARWASRFPVSPPAAVEHVPSSGGAERASGGDLSPSPAGAVAESCSGGLGGDGASSAEGPPLRAHPSGGSGSSPGVAGDADADSDPFPPSGGSGLVADADIAAPVPSRSAVGDRESILAVVNAATRPSRGSGGTTAAAEALQRRTATVRTASPASSGDSAAERRRTYNAEQKRRKRAAQRQGSA